MDRIGKLVEKMTRAGEQWGFDMKSRGTYNTVEHKYSLGDNFPLSFIVNSESLLFYFRPPLFRVVPERLLQELLRDSGTEYAATPRRNTVAYKVRITNQTECDSIIAFIDSGIIPRLGLTQISDARRARGLTEFLEP